MDGSWSSAVRRALPLFVPERVDDSPRPRTVRDWIVDTLFVVLSFGFGALTYSADAGHLTTAEVAIDWSLGLIAVVLIWWRRRFPISVAVLTALFTIVSGSAAAASIAGLFTAAVHRRWQAVVPVVVVNIGCGALYAVYRPQSIAFGYTMTVDVSVALVIVAWGMYIRARRQLVQSLRERAETAEAEQRMLAEQARLGERTRIAREMHDVLAHRISLLALHAGGLEMRPDLPPEQVRESARLLRDTAHRALEELRGVIGVLRDDDASDLAPAAPQPTLRDIPRLIDETRQAGARIRFTMSVPSGAALPDSVGRDAYRIVQEALTNVAKHARGTTTSVEVSGSPGDGLRVDVRNKLPMVASTPTIPGSGTGLVGLRERVTLSGGSLTHGPNDAGEFEIDARLTWPA